VLQYRRTNGRAAPDETMILPVAGIRYSFICQGTSTRRSEVTFSVFESSYHLLTYYQSNHSKVEAIPLSALPKDTTKANLPDYNRPTSL